ncbi:MAG: hypothetical protein QM727_08070 [Niabella sp.]
MKTLKLLVLGLVTLVSVNTFAAESGAGDNKEKVAYIGNLNELPVYQLSLNNAEKASYVVSIKDEDGSVIYTEKISGANIVRNYQFEDAPTGVYSLTFEVSNLNDKTKNVYKIDKTKKVIDEVAVKEVK